MLQAASAAQRLSFDSHTSPYYKTLERLCSDAPKIHFVEQVIDDLTKMKFKSEEDDEARTVPEKVGYHEQQCGGDVYSNEGIISPTPEPPSNSKPNCLLLY